MKFIIFILLIFSFTVNSNEFNYKNVGTLVRNEVMNFPGGAKFIAFKHSGGFETDIGKYGKYQCNGSIYIIKNLLLKICILLVSLKIRMGMFL